MEEVVPFFIKRVHHCRVHSWSIAWSEWHYAKRIFFMVGREKCELLLIRGSDADLVVSCFIV
jgi:hypothetical protein